VISQSGNAISVARSVLVEEFGGATIESASMVRSAYRERTVTRDSGTVRDLYGGPSRIREMAVFEVDERGGSTIGRVRVQVERLENRSAAELSAGGWRNSPGEETAITRDAANTPAQLDRWVFVRRNTALEQKLLLTWERRLRGEPGVEPERPQEASADTAPTD
jgi:hypothetical protein